MAKRNGLIVGAIVGLVLFPSVGRGAPERSTTVCTWGGTPAAPTGTFTIKPGLTVQPATDPLKFVARGPLEGGPGCSGEVVFDGTIAAGSTCQNQIFEGKVKGLPGVDSFWGPGAATLVSELLYDKDGNVVGADQPEAASGATKGGSDIPDCNTSDGFVDGNFSSLVELWR